MAINNDKDLARANAEIEKNLRRILRRVDSDAFKGLHKVGAFIKGESIEIAPHDKGDLIGSAFFRTDRALNIVRVGYTVKYAPFVHEMPNDTKWSKPGTGNKFLEKPVKNNLKKIIEILWEQARIR